MPISFRILGPLEVDKHGRLLRLGGAKQRGLLALLLLHPNEVVSSERLVDELWNESPPTGAAKALQVYVSRLRRALGEESRDGSNGVLLTRDHGYLLRVAAGELDLDRFQLLVEQGRRELAAGEAGVAATTLDEALGLWRGRPLEDLGHESFLQVEIRRLEDLHIEALEERFEAHLAFGHHAAVVTELEGTAARHPFRERLQAQLMLALHRCGRQAEALEVYRRTRRLLAEELGLEPGNALKELERAILVDDPALRGPAGAVDPGPVLTRRRSGRWIAAAVALAGVVAVSLLVLDRSSSAVAVSANSIAIVDPNTDRVIGDVKVGSGPDAVAAGSTGVWVANGDDGTVTRIDPRTRKVVSTLGVGADVSDIAVGLGSVWVADGNDGTLTRIDPSQNAVEATFHFGSASDLSPEPLFSVTTGDHAVWVTRGDRLLRIDPGSGRVTLRAHVAVPQGLVEHDGIAWVTTTADRLLRVSAATGAVTDSVPLPDRGITPILAHGTLWVIVGNPGEAPDATRLWQIDPETGTTTATVPAAFADNLAAGANAIWIARANGTVQRLDSSADRVARTLRIGHQPSAVAVGDGYVWVAVQSASG